MGAHHTDSTAASRRARRGRSVRRDARFWPMLVGPAGAAAVRRSASVLVLVALDVTAAFAGIYAALALKLLYQGHAISPDAIWAVEQKALPVAAGTLILLFAKNGLYGPREQRGGAARVLSSVTLATVIVLVVVVLAGWRFDTYYIFYSSWILVSAGVLILRASYDSITGVLLDALKFERRVAMVGQPGLMGSIASSLEGDRRRRVPYRVVSRHLLVPGLSTGDNPEAQALRAALDPDRVDEVILTGTSGDDGATFELLDLCRLRGLPVRLAPTTTELLSHSVRAVPTPGVPLFELRPPVLDGVAFITKRLFDLVFGALIGLLVLPILALAALAIKLDDGGPIIHRSRRVGVDETVFDCLKLRTMVVDAEARQAELEARNEADGALFKLKDDDRITRVGHLLRRLSIDELPQLWNVIRGEMSLVGPRPLPLRDYELLDEIHKKRYLVLPGITGLWQVSGRSDLSFDDLVRLDFYYIESWSIWLDITILARTIPTVFSRRGAY
ncbi:MAG TPA: exopolysaccharide biosynthesis polyprenyl glycosylphosphotransferase [Miltoncostaeaceae bacterium]|nr:exopolysaccharide biosynthesis polyprenyl glycosylphosphotransferase [Miltoncostaeaceae bacterium]